MKPCRPLSTSPFDRPLAWGLVAGALLMPVTAAEDGDQLYRMSLRELLEVKSTVATRSAKTTAQSPSSVTVYRQADFRRMGVTTLEELLNFVPGIHTSRLDHIATPPTVRGHRSGVSANDILILLDGIRLNDPVEGGAFKNFPFISLESLAQVEVIRGPGSALYGSNALSGVINLISKTGVNEIKLAAGNHHSQALSLLWHPALEKATLDLALAGYQDGGIGYPAFFEFFGEREPTRDPVDGYDAHARITRAGVALKLGYHYRSRQRFVFGGSQGGNDGPHRLLSKNAYVQLAYEARPTQQLEYRLYGEQTRFYWDALVRIAPAPFAGWSNNADIDLIGGNVRTSYHRRAGLDGQWRPRDNHRLRFGLVWREETTDTNSFQGNWDAEVLGQSGGTVLLPTPGEVNRGFHIDDSGEFTFIDDTQRHMWGAYLQYETRLAEQLALTAGLRHDNYHAVGASNSFRGSLLYQLSPATTLKLLYGQAFRAPTIGETSFNRSSIVVGNPDLAPESVDTLEWVINYRQPTWQWNLTWYDSRVSDVIKPVFVEGALENFNALQSQNAGHQDLRGWETELITSLGDHWQLRGGLSKAIDADETAAARELAFLALNFQQDRWNLNLNGYYHGRVISRTAEMQGAGRNIELGSYWKCNTNLRYRLNDDTTVFFKTDNLFDRHFQTYTDTAGLETGLPARGRMISVGLVRKF